MRDGVRKGWLCVCASTVCLFVERIDAVIPPHSLPYFIPQRWGTKSLRPISEVGFAHAFQSTQGPTVCLPGFWLCVCNVKVAVSDLDNMQEIKPNYRSKIGTIYNPKAIHSNHVFTDHAVCKSNSCDYEHSARLCYRDKMYRHRIMPKLLHSALTKTFLLSGNKHPLQNEQNREATVKAPPVGL